MMQCTVVYHIYDMLHCSILSYIILGYSMIFPKLSLTEGVLTDLDKRGLGSSLALFVAAADHFVL